MIGEAVNKFPKYCHTQKSCSSSQQIINMVLRVSLVKQLLLAMLQNKTDFLYKAFGNTLLSLPPKSLPNREGILTLLIDSWFSPFVSRKKIKKIVSFVVLLYENMFLY